MTTRSSYLRRAWPLAVIAIGAPLGFALWVRYHLGLDIDILATALQAAPIPAAILPVGLCLGHAAASLRRLWSGELGTAGVLKSIVAPAGLGIGLGGAAILWGLPRLGIALNRPTRRSLEKYELFQDDALKDKNPAFDANLVDPRPFEGYQVNASAAVLALSIEKEEPGADKGYSRLHPSYAAAARSWAGKGEKVLPSINAVDGKAKQFDDGLMAALQHALARGKAGPGQDLGAFLSPLLDRLDPKGKAHAWVWGGLKLSGHLPPERSPVAPKDAAGFMAAFEQELDARPYGFYAWSPELGETYRLIRYFRAELAPDDPRAAEIAALLARDPGLMSRYAGVLKWIARVEAGTSRTASLGELALSLGGRGPRPRGSASLLPSPRSKEDLLFMKLFGAGLPPGADLMLELVKAIRSGKLDLKPGSEAGWYEHQAYALETFLLPERGAETQKLLLDKEYKKRMLRAFAAILAKRRETHALMGMFALGELVEGEGGPPKQPLPPRLRVEPNPTYYLRMARSYAFLEAFLRSSLPKGGLDKLRGFKEGGLRKFPLGQELAEIKDLFYGLHLISCADLGMPAMLSAAEAAGKARGLKLASDWLSRWDQDPDLAQDSRVIVPIAFDPERGVARLWGTLGVHGAKLSAYYARAPQWRPAPSAGKAPPWESAATIGAGWIILVDEFAEVESRRDRIPSRREFQALVDREGSAEKVIAALAR